MTLQALLDSKLVWALGGALISLTMAYFAFSKDITKELAFIRGQLSALLKHLDRQNVTHDRVVVLDREHVKVRHDLDNAFKAIRELKEGVSNGSAAETSGHG